jgi:hypothetical protein
MIYSKTCDMLTIWSIRDIILCQQGLRVSKDLWYNFGALNIAQTYSLILAA